MIINVWHWTWLVLQWLVLRTQNDVFMCTLHDCGIIIPCMSGYNRACMTEPHTVQCQMCLSGIIYGECTNGGTCMWSIAATIYSQLIDLAHSMITPKCKILIIHVYNAATIIRSWWLHCSSRVLTILLLLIVAWWTLVARSTQTDRSKASTFLII